MYFYFTKEEEEEEDIKFRNSLTLCTICYLVIFACKITTLLHITVIVALRNFARRRRRQTNKALV